MKRLLCALLIGLLEFHPAFAGPFAASSGAAAGISGAQRTVASGTTSTATTGDYVMLWNSSGSSAKTQTIPDCASGTNKTQLLIGDEAQTAGTYNDHDRAGDCGDHQQPVVDPDREQRRLRVAHLRRREHELGSDVSEHDEFCQALRRAACRLVTATPVMTTTQNAKGTLYYTAYKGGGKVPYYNGAFDANDSIPSNEVSTAMATTSTGVFSALNVFDVWWSSANHNICVATNGSGGGWASDTGGSNTARGTGYSQLDTTSRPYATNKNAITHCYNGATDYGAVSANRLTYLGTIKTDASSAGKVNWIFGGTASGGTAGEFGICNYYNVVPVATQVLDSATTWTYGTASWRAFDGSGTGSGANNRVTWVSCNGEDAVVASFIAGTAAGASNQSGAIGIGVDSSTAVTGGVAGQHHESRNIMVHYAGNPGAGIHYLQAIEFGNATNATNFYGNATSNGTTIQSALSWRGQQ
jgi:hypothetical protein